VAAVCLIQFIDVMGVTVVVTALPKMLTDVGASSADGSLVATGYEMFFGGLPMFGARLGDRFGHRRTIVISLGVFGVGALLASTATSIVSLTAAGCIQGAGAAGAVPSALTLLTSLAGSGRARARAVAAWSAAGAAAGASGFVVGGLVTDVASWRLIFWVLLAVSAVQTVAVIALGPP
jgi:MFS family permease